MKRINCRFTCSTAVFIAAVCFCMSIVLARPLPSRAAETTSPESKPKASQIDRTEARINELHAKLKITPAQEEQWSKVAQVMRENATTMETLIQARREKGNKLNAVEDLRSYSTITDAHATGLKNFIAAFEPLYASMSDEQKKIADTIFTKHDQRRSKKK
ncbi:MAG TPA: Spy/CpxP family protein refolding chaperone [Syntrophorhabdales bacterium]|nr:Spy/CpxP family protein refolding chaperone [Syntrophorhabdales bacterium]